MIGLAGGSVVGAGICPSKIQGHRIELGRAEDVLAGGKHITVIRILAGAGLLQRAGGRRRYYVAAALVCAGVGVGDVQDLRTVATVPGWIQNLREVALPLARRWHAIGVRSRSSYEAPLLDVAKEKQLVLDDRPAQGSAKLIHVEHRRGRAYGLSPNQRVQFRISHVLPEIPVNCVSTGLGGGIQHSGVAAPNLRAVVVGFHLELGDGIRRRQDAVGRAIDVVVVRGIVVGAVEHVVVLLILLAVGRETASAGAAPYIRRHARRFLGNKGPVAIGQRRVVEELGVNIRGRFRCLCLHQRRHRCYRNRLRRFARLESQGNV